MKDLDNPLDKLDAKTRTFVEMRVEEATAARPELSIFAPLPHQGTNSVVFAAQWDSAPAVVKVSIRDQAKDEAKALLKLEPLSLYPRLFFHIPPDVLVLEQINGIPWAVSLRAGDETYLATAINAFIHLTEALGEEPAPPNRLASSIRGTLLTVEELFQYHPAIFARPEIENAYETVKTVTHRLTQEPPTWYIDDPGPDNLLISDRGFERFVDASLDSGNRVIHVAGFLERIAHRTDSLEISRVASKAVIKHFALEPDVVLAAALLRPLINLSRYHRWNGWKTWPDRRQLLSSETEELERARYVMNSIVTIRRHLKLNPTP